ncbi:hypothetical protein ACFCX0_47405 [Streptomyces sp. NPDC056352]|uniref:hypothetical protein n=1 Tax=Streptomyces sp. NPDC056352 TaxID=3345791 RepID=UPI0035E2C6B8
MVQVVQRAEVAARQPITPRFCDSSTRVLIAEYMETVERERSLAGTFGGADWLWDTPDELR